MSLYRIAAVLAALLLALLLGWTIYGATQTEKLVLPTGGVIDGGPADSLPSDAGMVAALRDRTALQDWRGDSGPSPARQVEPVTTGTAEAGEPQRAGMPPILLAETWLAVEEDEWDLLRDRGFLEGWISLPDEKLAVLEQPQGRTWRGLHNEEIAFGGGIVIFGFSLLLALFLAARGRVPLSEGYSGRRVLRFTALERANHWVTASSFLLMALTGLLLLYGQYLLKPLLGAEAYHVWALASAWIHMVLVVPFVLGVLVMAVLWLRQNLPSKVDFIWLKRFGGMLHDSPDNPPARRFNAGQKLIFWAVLLGMLALLATGLSLMFPFFWLGIIGMQAAQLLHAAVGLCMIAVIIGHIYIGTVGMEGAFDAMWDGTVDYNWAKEHHDLWLEEKERKGAA